MRFGYYTDLRGFQFSDTSQQTWITAMRVGEYLHPIHGKIQFTPDRLLRFAESVKRKVRGIDLDIDYDHKTDPTKGNEAAGWVKDAKVEGDTLKLLVDWTQSAVQKIKEGAYRYFSPEFQDSWTDAAGNTHQDVLFGGGLTNRPFLKDLLPVNLSELQFDRTALAEPNKEGTEMDRKKIAKALGLPEDATDEQIETTATNYKSAAQNKGGGVDHTATTHAPNQGATTSPGGTIDGKPVDATTATGVDKDGNMITPEEVQLSELAKTNPGLAAMMRAQMAQNKALSEQVANLAQQNQVAQVRVKLSEYKTGNKIIAPAILDEATPLLAALPIQLHDKVYGLLNKVRDLGANGSVQLGESTASNGSNTNPSGTSAVDEFEALIVTQRKKFHETTGKELDYSEALLDVASNNPELYKRYRDESYLFKA
jgi:phage I-like protein